MAKRERVRKRGAAQKPESESRWRYWPVALALILIYGIGGVFFLRSMRGRSSAPASEGERAALQEPGVAVPIQGRDHVQPGQSHPPYNSDPPTSGWHYDHAIPAGFYEEPQADEALVHNLEHGHIVIAYDCTKLPDCEATKAKLKELVGRYNTWKITVVPRENKDAPLALTAWGRIAKLDDYDEARITAFIDAYRDKGPEKTPE